MARRKARHHANGATEETPRGEAAPEEHRRTTGTATAEAATPPAAERRTSAPTAGAQAEEPGPEGEEGEAGPSAMERAEDMVDRFAQKVGHYTSVFGRALLRFGARAREEAEDIWAEAQHLRRGGKP